MGNVWEWNEALINGFERGNRGGVYSGIDYYLASSYQNEADPAYEHGDVGFRVASVPEPSTLLLLSLGAVMLRRKR